MLCFFPKALQILKAFQQVQIFWWAEGAEQTSQFAGITPSQICCTDIGAPHGHYSS